VTLPVLERTLTITSLVVKVGTRQRTKITRLPLVTPRDFNYHFNHKRAWHYHQRKAVNEITCKIRTPLHLAVNSSTCCTWFWWIVLTVA
jgi:hypothetical protein